MHILLDEAIFRNSDEQKEFTDIADKMGLSYTISGLVKTYTSNDLATEYNIDPTNTFVYGAIPFCRSRITTTFHGNYLSPLCRGISPKVYNYQSLVKPGLKDSVLSSRGKIDYLLNSDCKYVMFGLGYEDYHYELTEEFTKKDYGDKVFIRPNNPYKTNASTVVNTADIFSYIKENGYLELMLGFYIAPYKEIVDEVRCIYYQGKIVTASYYIINGEIKYKKTVATRELEDILHSCLKLRLKMSKIPLVIDFAKCNGEWKLLEVNCISSSGLYECSIEKTLECVKDSLSNG